MLDAIPDASHQEARPWESGGESPGGVLPAKYWWALSTIPIPQSPTAKLGGPNSPSAQCRRLMGPLRKGPVSDSASPGLWPVSQEMLLYSLVLGHDKGIKDRVLAAVTPSVPERP